jgi:uncharacterized protein
MKPRVRDPLRLDIEAFAKEGGRLDGRWPLTGFERLAGSAHPEARPDESDEVAWHAEGELRPVRGGDPEVWLHVRAEAQMSLECQRCLQPVGAPLSARRSFRFVADEATAAEIDADCEDDVLALTRALNLHDLVEDELILSLPLVPMHEACPEPLEAPAKDEPPAEERPNPFAALAALKRQGPH